jgi:hypothetical protein
VEIKLSVKKCTKTMIIVIIKPYRKQLNKVERISSELKEFVRKQSEIYSQQFFKFYKTISSVMQKRKADNEIENMQVKKLKK